MYVPAHRPSRSRQLTPDLSVSQEQLAQLYNTWARFADAAGGIQSKEFVQVSLALRPPRNQRLTCVLLQGLKTIGVPEMLIEPCWALYTQPIKDTVPYQVSSARLVSPGWLAGWLASSDGLCCRNSAVFLPLC